MKGKILNNVVDMNLCLLIKYQGIKQNLLGRKKLTEAPVSFLLNKM